MENSIDYETLFGIGETGEEETGAAEPSADTGTETQSDEITAEPDRDAAAQTSETAEDGEHQAAAEAGGTEARETAEPSAVQSPEENARYAAARRKAEAQRDAAIQRAREDAQAEARRVIDEAFKNSGLTNPYTKQPITSKEEYDLYRQRFDAERKSRIIKSSGMSDKEFDAFVSELPEVKQARETQEKAEKAERDAREAQARSQMEQDLKEISKLDPGIRELKDLAGMDTYPQFYELVKRGNTLIDAYKLANFDTLTRSAAQATRQAAINSVQSKRHMSQTTARGAGAVAVPGDVKEMYRALNPGATDAEIQAHYNRSHKKG